MRGPSVNAWMLQRLMTAGWVDETAARALQPHLSGSSEAFYELLRRWGRIPEAQLLQLAREAAAHASSTAAAPLLSQGAATTAASHALTASAASAPPRHIDGYEIVGILGEGGMGVVYKARDPNLDGFVAIKVLLAGERASLELLERFVAEAQTLQKLREHPNIVKVLRARREGRSAFMVMELVEGTDLKGLIDRGELSSEESARIVAEVAGALEHAHSFGIIHRDLKPANILLDAQRRPRLTDFGVAKVGAAGSHTMTGAMLGTISYMAPEQAEDSSKADERTDVYGLGAILYACLTGRPPHVGSSPTNILSSLLSKEPPRPSELNPEVDPQVEAVCLRALARDPEARYASAHEMQLDLEAVLAGEELAAPGRGLPVAYLALPMLLILALAALLFASLLPAAPPPRIALAEPLPEVLWRREPGPMTLELPLLDPAPATWPEAAWVALEDAAQGRRLGELRGATARFEALPFEDGARFTLLASADGEATQSLGELTLRRDLEAPRAIAIEGAGMRLESPRGFVLAEEVTLSARFSEAVRWQLLLAGAGEGGREGSEEGGRVLAAGEGAIAVAPIALLEVGMHALRWSFEDAAGWRAEVAVEVERAAPVAEEIELELSYENGAFALAATTSLEVTSLELGAEVPVSSTELPGEPRRRFHARLEPEMLLDARAAAAFARLGWRFDESLLADLAAWDRAHETAAGRARARFSAAVIAARLAPDLVRFTMEPVECGDIRREVAVYETRDDTLLLHLIPGAPGLAPFLCSRNELTIQTWEGIKPLPEVALPVARALDRMPVFGLTWRGAHQAVEGLVVGGQQLALPTPEEWVHACRGGSAHPYFWGPEPQASGQLVRAEAVKLIGLERRPRPGNGFGLLDMIGNVREWVEAEAPAPGPASVEWGYAYGGRATGELSPEMRRCDARERVPKLSPPAPYLIKTFKLKDEARLREVQAEIPARLEPFYLTGARPILRLPEAWLAPRSGTPEAP